MRAHDLSYTPNFRQTDMASPSVDIFLRQARNHDVKSIAQSVDTLIANVDKEMKRLQSKTTNTTITTARNNKHAASPKHSNNNNNKHDEQVFALTRT